MPTVTRPSLGIISPAVKKLNNVFKWKCCCYCYTGVCRRCLNTSVEQNIASQHYYKSILSVFRIFNAYGTINKVKQSARVSGNLFHRVLRDRWAAWAAAEYHSSESLISAWRGREVKAVRTLLHNHLHRTVTARHSNTVDTPYTITWRQAFVFYKEITHLQ